jgi:hypothetical protein
MGSVLTRKVILAVFLLWFATTAEAGWLIENERFHVSVHGQLSCQDCHEGISERKRHLNSADVNKTLKDFFQSAGNGKMQSMSQIPGQAAGFF